MISSPRRPRPSLHGHRTPSTPDAIGGPRSLQYLRDLRPPERVTCGISCCEETRGDVVPALVHQRREPSLASVRD